jgi:protease I
MKIACVLGPMFEDSEFKLPYDAFKQAGHEVTVIGLEAGAQLQGSKGKETATVERTFGQVSPEQFDALLIPGGSSPDKLRAHDEAVAFTRSFMDAGKPDTYKQHRMTAWKTVLEDLRKAGADVVDEEVVVDRNLVTSRKPDDIPAFIRESLKVIEGVPAAR